MRGKATNKKEIKKYLYYTLSVALWLVVWHVAAKLLDKEILLVTPYRAVVRLFELSLTESFWKAVLTSLGKIVGGFLTACVVGILLASLSAAAKVVYIFLNPLFTVIKATPVTSFIILAILWVKSPYLTSFISFSTAVPLVYFNVYQGIKSANSDILEMSRVFNVSLAGRISKVYVQSAAPFFITAAATGIGFAWKSGIAAEIIGYQGASIGSMIYYAKLYLETADLFAWTLAVILLSMLTEYAFKRVARWLYGDGAAKSRKEL